MLATLLTLILFLLCSSHSCNFKFYSELIVSKTLFKEKFITPIIFLLFWQGLFVSLEYNLLEVIFIEHFKVIQVYHF